MAKIDSNLAKNITRKPDKEFNVIIVIDLGKDFEELHLRNYKKLMDNIAYAKLTGYEINQASNSPWVLSIEEDKEMGII